MSNPSSELPGSVELFATAAGELCSGEHRWRYACPNCDQLTAPDPHTDCVDCAPPQPRRRRRAKTAKTVKPGASGGER